jgi:hypothetical protein
VDRARAVAAVVSLSLLGATLWPALGNPRDDGFPMSTYPMFASKRPTLQTYRYALGETASGQRRVLQPILVGTGEVLQAIRVIDRALASGRPEARRLCEAIAMRVAVADDFSDVVAIRLVTGTHDAVEYLARDVVGRESELLRCAVPR